MPTRPWALALLTVAVTIASIAGCGGADASTPEGTVDAFLEAATTGDAETACALVDSGAEVPFYTGMGFEPTEDCETEVTANAADEDFANVEWTLTTVEGSDNVVTAEFAEPPGGANLLNFTLEQGGDDWTIATVGPRP